MISAHPPKLNPPWPAANIRGKTKAGYMTVKADSALAIRERSIQDEGGGKDREWQSNENIFWSTSPRYNVGYEARYLT